MSEQKEKRAQTSGKCQLCGETFTKQAMSRHLKSCIDKSASAKSPAGSKAKPADTFLISVEGKYLPQYWMHLEARVDATLDDIDELLRDVWLECCGHLSSFSVPGKRYDSTPDTFGGFFDDDEAGGMDEKLSDVLNPGQKIDYEYDFGTTTDLKLKVVSRHTNRSLKKAVEILARNEDPQIPCDYCGAPAKKVCSSCIWSGEGWVCNKCKRKHKCDEDYFLPVLNSPRTGMCGYEG